MAGEGAQPARGAEVCAHFALLCFGKDGVVEQMRGGAWTVYVRWSNKPHVAAVRNKEMCVA